ncbi:uncharacterized protein LOC123305633 isoform X2 [Chrysoperla carnea]|uniref:uncharacterized protein LOC123305633 isoform X2 n=1 Tax=Chrysoperla carnea TaxID=189513 RepID=UPI001D06270A|nr:uncharacterized protein LOC123305633 isoform X2 [Chrysoperla carnea]
MLHHRQFRLYILQMPLTDSLNSSNDGGGFHAIKRGLLWQQRDRLFSRWKERYFVLTRDYLHCFKRATNRTISSDMGHFIFKIKLLDVERIEWHNKKTYSTVTLDLGSNSGGGRILLRAAPQATITNNPSAAIGDGLEDWFELLEECTINSKERRKTLINQHRHSRDNNNMNSIQSTLLDEWLLARKHENGLSSVHCDSVPDLEEALAIKKRDKRWVPPDDDDDDWNSTTHSNRLSLLTDIDINAGCDSGASGGDTTPPSISSTSRDQPPHGYRLNSNVFFLAANHSDNAYSDAFIRGITQGRSSFNSPTKSNGSGTPINTNGRRTQEPVIQHQMIRYRERSHSDIQRIDRRPWRMRDDQQKRNSHLLDAAQS